MVQGLDMQVSGADLLARQGFEGVGAGGGGEFRSILRRAQASEDPKVRARETAEEFVAQALVLPVLKSIREQNNAAAPFGPGPYEKNIASLYDTEVALRLVKAQRFGIVDAVARNLLRVGGGSASETPVKEQGGSDVNASGTPSVIGPNQS